MYSMYRMYSMFRMYRVYSMYSMCHCKGFAREVLPDPSFELVK